MHHPTDRISHITAFVAPVVEHWLELEIAQRIHHEGSIRRPIAPSRSYHGATSHSLTKLFIYDILALLLITINLRNCHMYYRHIPEFVVKSILSQSSDLFNGQIKSYLKIYTFNLFLHNYLHNHHISLIDDI